MSQTSIPDQIDAHHLLVQVGAGRSTATYRRDQTIFRQGEAADVVFFVQRGAVELSLKSKDDVETVLGQAKEGQFFGGACLYDVPVRIATATAVIESRITSVTKAAILAAIRERPRFAKMFTDHLWHNMTSQKYLLSHLLNWQKRRDVTFRQPTERLTLTQRRHYSRKPFHV